MNHIEFFHVLLFASKDNNPTSLAQGFTNVISKISGILLEHKQTDFLKCYFESFNPKMKDKKLALLGEKAIQEFQKLENMANRDTLHGTLSVINVPQWVKLVENIKLTNKNENAPTIMRRDLITLFFASQNTVYRTRVALDELNCSEFTELIMRYLALYYRITDINDISNILPHISEFIDQIDIEFLDTNEQATLPAFI